MLDAMPMEKGKGTAKICRARARRGRHCTVSAIGNTLSALAAAIDLIPRSASFCCLYAVMYHGM
eukprot:1161328-Pelagomonas_calceolata.AAC.5